MQHARHVFRQEAGPERELEVFKMHEKDIDAYIEAACSQPAQGMVCLRCKKPQVIIELRQTRSADEGMTAYAKCRACNFERVYS